jgi:purine nucleosidase/pyrimidine-specific ribonucleoside hydrolase
MKSVLIDCDPGIDDSVALLFALSNPSLNIKAITTVSGNLIAPTCSSNLRKILHLSGNTSAKSIPLGTGPSKPLVRPYPRDPFSHGSDGLADLGITSEGDFVDSGIYAPDLIVSTVNANPDITILCLGPLTNLALATMKDSSLPSKAKEVLFIGGSFGFNTTGTGVRATGDNPVSEWNVYVDPEAAQLVFEAGYNLTALGLDVVTRPDLELGAMYLDVLDTASWRDKNKSAGFLLDCVKFAKKRGFQSWCCLIDSVAVATAISSKVVKTCEIEVVVETQSKLSLGQTIVERRERKEHRWQPGLGIGLSKIKAAYDIDVEKFLDCLVFSITEHEKPLHQKE